MSVRTEVAIQRPPTLGLAVTALAVIAVVSLSALLLFQGRGEPRSERAFGMLPAPTGGMPVGGGGLGPGTDAATGSISYTVPSDLVLPESALAFRLRPIEISESMVRGIAERLGIVGEVEQLLGEDGTLLGYHVEPADVDPREPRSFFEVTLEGQLSYGTPMMIPEPGSAAPTPEQAMQAAREWLRRTGIAPNYSVMRSEGPCGEGCWTVTAGPVENVLRVVPVGLSQPLINISVVGAGEVANAGGSWAVIEAESSYALHSLDELTAELEATRGSFFEMIGSGTGLALPSDFFTLVEQKTDAAAMVQRVRLGYTLGVDKDGQRFLIPVHIVEGTLTQAGLQQPEPFVAWVPATDTKAEVQEEPIPQGP